MIRAPRRTPRKRGRRSAAGIAAAIGWVALAAACGPSRRTEPLMGPLRLTTESEQRGQVVYMKYCHQCHPGGEAGLGPSLNEKPLPDFLKKFQVREGIGSMPSFSDEQISDAELDDLIAYMDALRDHDDRELPVPDETVEPSD